MKFSLVISKLTPKNIVEYGHRTVGLAAILHCSSVRHLKSGGKHFWSALFSLKSAAAVVTSKGETVEWAEGSSGDRPTPVPVLASIPWRQMKQRV